MGQLKYPVAGDDLAGLQTGVAYPLRVVPFRPAVAPAGGAPDVVQVVEGIARPRAGNGRHERSLGLALGDIGCVTEMLKTGQGTGGDQASGFAHIAEVGEGFLLAIICSARGCPSAAAWLPARFCRSGRPWAGTRESIPPGRGCLPAIHTAGKIIVFIKTVYIVVNSNEPNSLLP